MGWMAGFCWEAELQHSLIPVKISLKIFGSVLLVAALWLLFGVLWLLVTPQAGQAPDRLLIYKFMQKAG